MGAGVCAQRRSSLWDLCPWASICLRTRQATSSAEKGLEEAEDLRSMSSVRCALGTRRDISQWCWSPGAVVPAISLHSGVFSAELSHQGGRDEVHTMRLIWFGVFAECRG